MTRTELSELSSSLRALRAENARLEARLDKLEQVSAVTSTKRSGAAAAATTTSTQAPAPASADRIPSLMVVKLKPRAQAAPKIATRVEVAEPPESIVDELKSSPDKAESDVDQQIAEAAYEHGVDALKTGNAEAGMAQLLQFASENPRHPHADNALYYVGLTQMAQQDFAGASQLFERVIAQYPAADSVLDSMLKLGECRVRLKQPQLARSTWEKLINAFPGTPGAAQARTNLAALSTSP